MTLPQAPEEMVRRLRNASCDCGDKDCRFYRDIISEAATMIETLSRAPSDEELREIAGKHYRLWSKDEDPLGSHFGTQDAIYAALKDISVSGLVRNEWIPITGEIKRKVLVTNNLHARDAFGQMSHVWRVIMVHEQAGPEGPYSAYDDSDRLIWGLTHYAELPLHSSPNTGKEG